LEVATKPVVFTGYPASRWTLGDYMRSWLRFEDKSPSELFDPASETWVPTYSAFDRSEGVMGGVGWTRENWLIRSALVAPSSASAAARHLWTHDISFDPWWNEGEFDFGVKKVARGGINLYPWIHTYKHPTTGNQEIRLREDFIRYHALVRVGDAEWRHPVDETPVAKLGLVEHDCGDPSPCVLVYRRYLLDYLAAMGRQLLICVVSDRFATCGSKVELGIENRQEERVSKWTRLTTNFTDFPGHVGSAETGRGTLIRNRVLAPSAGPAIQDSPWHSVSVAANVSGAPEFIVDDEGSRVRLDQINPVTYLYFKPEVLERHFTDKSYGVFFHMRTWGRAWHPVGDVGVDVGINSEGLVVAFVKDLQDLRPADQNYWSGFSVNPHGDVCEEMYLTRMMCAPPRSPGTVALLEEARSSLHVAFRDRFGDELFEERAPSEKVKMRLSVGPLRGADAELGRLAKDVFIWLGDGLRKKALKPHCGLAKEAKNKLGSIRLLEHVLKQSGAMSPRTVCLPLDALRRLRISDAHVEPGALREVQAQLGLTSDVQGRDLWFALVDAVADSFKSAADELKLSED